MNTETDRDPADIADALDLLDALLADLGPERLREIAGAIHWHRYRNRRADVLWAAERREGVGVRRARHEALREVRRTAGPTTLLVLTADALSVTLDGVARGERVPDAVRSLVADLAGVGADVADLIATAVPFVAALVEPPER